MSFRTDLLAGIPLVIDEGDESPIPEDALTEQDMIFMKDDIELEVPMRVYRANFDGRTVAVKEMFYEDENLLRCLKYEKHTHKKLTDLNVANIATYYGYQVTEQTYSIVMEYGPRTLADWLDYSLGNPADDNALTHEIALPILRDVTRAVAGMHDQRIAHYDIKDANVLLMQDGTAKLIDFGFARELDLDTGPLPIGMGTNGWAPPEVYTNDYARTEKVDIYSLSTVYWQCMEINLPRSNDLSIREKIFTDQPEAFIKTPPGIARLIGQGWLRDPAKRPSAAEMLKELDKPDLLIVPTAN